MRKQTIILTAGLTTPFLCIALIMTWIFVTLDKDKLMADAPPVGAGAGDTGNANALGQWLAGRNPDEISKANDARREGTAIDPFNWPGGTRLIFTHTPPSDQPSNPPSDSPTNPPKRLEARIIIQADSKRIIFVRHPQHLGDNLWSITLDQIGPTVSNAQIAIGYRTPNSESSTWPTTPIPLTNIKPRDTLASDPISIPLDINIFNP